MTVLELRQEIAALQAQLREAVAFEKAAELVDLKRRFTKCDELLSHESDGIVESEVELLVFHSGMEFDFTESLSERDHDGRKDLLYNLEERGLCVVLEK